MSDIQLIVERLNSPPFNLNLTLVSFDEKSPSELVQTLHDVWAELDRAHKVDVREEAQEVAVARISTCLQVIKYPLPTDVYVTRARRDHCFGAIHGSHVVLCRDGFVAGILRGERSCIYPVLAYTLSKLPALKKRAYVARYLLPVEVPPEFAHDAAIQVCCARPVHRHDAASVHDRHRVQEALAQYRELQAEFKETHKALERVAGTTAGKPSASELRKDVAQLEEERMQLVEKIASLKKRTADIPGFASLLEATSSLRKEQEEEGKLQDRLHEQRVALNAAERRYAEVNRRLAETRASTNEDMSAEAVLEAARREAHEGRQLARKVLPASLEARRETLQRLRRMLTEAPKTEEDLAILSREVAVLEDTVARLTQEVAAAQRAAGDDKLAMFRQQSALIAKKLAQKEEAMELARRESDALSRDIEAKEARLSEMSGPRYMRRDELKAYAATLRTKTNEFKTLKQELSDVRQETVVLARTEQVLKSRAGDVDEFLRKLEERRGVSGYTSVASDLEKISSLKARIDESKGKTLNEISRIVTDINAAIRDKKTKLAPAIKQLRNVRSEFSSLESVYVREKATYENVAAGLDAERIALEKEADATQEEFFREESRYHLLSTELEVLACRAGVCKEEGGYERGDGRFLRDFKTLKEVYATKLAQLETLAKELRRRQKDIKENSGAHAVQRSRLVHVCALLRAKRDMYAADPLGPLGAMREGASALEHMALSRAGQARGVGFEDTGAANVMSLE